MNIRNRTEKYLWLLILPVALVVYAVSFNNIPALEKDHSILGESDAAAFIVLITDFDLGKTYGDPYRLEGRKLEDVAQKHKIHHILYAMVASGAYKGLSALFTMLGLPARQALYAISAVIGCLNIFLLYLLLKKIDPQKKLKVVFLILYGFCLSSWIFHSVPESWPFSATLALFFLVLLYNRQVNPVILTIYVGLAMLNNIFLGTLCFFLIIHYWVSSGASMAFVAKTLGSIAGAIATWLAAMTLLSVFDSNFRPDHYFQYTFWFKRHIAPPVIIFDLYYWKSALTQLYITSILSNQSIPNVPQESLLYTFRQSMLGLIATAVYLVLLVTLGWHGVRRMYSELKQPGGLNVLLSSVYFPMALYGAAWLFLTVIMDTSGGFLYSTMVTPMIVAALYQFTDWKKWTHKTAWAVALSLILINNSQQIMSFRHTLLALGQ